MDVWDVDIARMMPFQGSSRYLHDRTVEGLGLLYAMHWPHRQPETARPVRTSPLHGRLARQGACFGELAGWERANWFAPAGVEARYEYSYGRQNWWQHSAAEHRTVRDSVGLFDQTSFSKHLVEGADATEVLSRICANRIDGPEGKVTYTQWLNERGGIEADLTVTRLGEERYLVVGYAGSQVRDAAWLRRHTPDEAAVVVTDVTSAFAVLGVMGPESRNLLAQLTNADLSNEGFPFGTSREIEIGYARARASRITFVGTLGWELYIPSEMASAVYDAIVAEGAGFGLEHAGYHAMGSLRMEKAYREWGHDVTPDDTPLEAGLGFAVAWNKPGGFLGQEALADQREKGVRRRLVGFALEDKEPLILHDEPIWRNGILTGRMTSGAFGHTVDRSLGLGYVEHDDGVSPDFVRSGTYEIEIACKRYAAEASLKPFFDAKRRTILA
jgi:4-methylaminobutanoate oxidase (formaldehyde-forming)